MYCRLDYVNALLWPMENQCASKSCTTTSGQFSLLNTNAAEDMGLTLNNASNFANTRVSQQVTYMS